MSLKYAKINKSLKPDMYEIKAWKKNLFQKLKKLLLWREVFVKSNSFCRDSELSMGRAMKDNNFDNWETLEL